MKQTISSNLKCLFFFVCFFFFQGLKGSFAQEILWQSQFNGITARSKFKTLVVDKDGNIYTTGVFSGTIEFETETGKVSLIAKRDLDLFIAKWNPNGKIAWIKHLTGNFVPHLLSISPDKSGQIYLSGSFIYHSVDMDPGPDSFVLSPSSAYSQNPFILKIDGNGNFKWAKKLESPNGTIEIGTLKTDGDGNVYVSGLFNGQIDIDGGGQFIISSLKERSWDCFLVKLDSNGAFSWAKNMTSTVSNYRDSPTLSLDNNGNFFITGSFVGNVDFDQDGKIDLYGTGFSNAYLAKFDRAGKWLWAKAISGSDFYKGDFLKVDQIEEDQEGNLFLKGIFNGTIDFDPGPGTSYLFGRYQSFYLAKFNSGLDLLWVRQLLGSNNFKLNDISIDKKGNVFTAGHFSNSLYLNVNQSNLPLTTDGKTNGFVVKYDPFGNIAWTKTIEDNGYCFIHSIALNDEGSVFAKGELSFFDDENPNFPFEKEPWKSFLIKMKNGDAIALHPKEIPFRIYPNPVQTYVTLELSDFQESHAEVINSFGQVMLRLEIKLPLSFLDLEDLPHGIYTIRIQNPRGSGHQKFFKKDFVFTW